MGLLVVTLALSFTGYLLPWDQLAYWAITIGANIAQSPREVTDALGMTEYFDPGGLQKLPPRVDGGGRRSAHPLLPPPRDDPSAGCSSLLLAVHFWRVRKDGGVARPVDARRVSGLRRRHLPGLHELRKRPTTWRPIVKGRTPAVGNGPENTVPSMPHLFYAEMGVFMLTIFICVLLALADAPLKELANPNIPENPAKAPWYFLGLQELVSFSAFMGGIGHSDDRAARARADPVPRPGDGRDGAVVRRPGRASAGAALDAFGFGAALLVETMRSGSGGSSSGSPTRRPSSSC
jgi:hypothetical protein